jgi:hypothetical protein
MLRWGNSHRPKCEVAALKNTKPVGFEVFTAGVAGNSILL